MKDSDAFDWGTYGPEPKLWLTEGARFVLTLLMIGIVGAGLVVFCG